MKNQVSCMRIRVAILLMSLALASGGAGYWLRSEKTDGSLVLSVRDVVREEYLVPPDSFSRVENTKNTLNALCARLRIGIQEATVRYDRLARNGESSKPEAAMVLDRAIHNAERVVGEFEGTAQQLYVIQDLLGLLERAGRLDLWTELYLKALREHPTHSAVLQLASKAVRFSKLSGQQKQLLDALRYASAFPAEFEGRREIDAALASLPLCFPQLEGFSMNCVPPHSGNEELMK